MIQLPRAFRRDAARIADIGNILSDMPPEGPRVTLQCKKMARELRQLLARWGKDPICLAEGKALALFQTRLRSLEGHIEEFYIASLLELLSKWRERLIQEALLDAEIISQQLIQNVIGAESTGTTTLAEVLASHFQTVWVPEYGREYSYEKQVRGETDWHTEEFLEIAHEQNRRENLAARIANRLLICDTNAFATTLWHRRYMGVDSVELQAIAKLCRADLYILTGDEIPFVQDGLRDGENIRHEMHRWFEQALEKQSTPWLLVRGSLRSRLQQVIDKIPSR